MKKLKALREVSYQSKHEADPDAVRPLDTTNYTNHKAAGHAISVNKQHSNIFVESNISFKFHLLHALREERQKSNVSLADAKQCQVKPLSCPGFQTALDPSYFTEMEQCATFPSLETCFANVSLNFTDLSRRNYYFVGNSVDRHYAFALRDILGTSPKSMSRAEEKKSCQGVLGTASCGFTFFTRSDIQTTVNFYWKNYLGMTQSYDDMSRDVCKDSQSEALFTDLFHNASSRDVLIIGSVPVDSEYFKKLGGHSSAPFHISAPQWLESQLHLRVHDILEMLLRTFPGAIIWHSYPFLNMNKNSFGNDLAFGDLNRCFSFGNSLIQCYARSYPRIAFLDLTSMQARRLPEYNDLIHHSGKISEDIVEIMLKLISQER